MRKLFFLWITLIAFSLGVHADDKVSFTATAPEAVAVGDQFRLSFTVTTNNVRDFRAPSIKGFEVLMGPSRSTQMSTSIVNGKATSSNSITFTYILMAKSEGSFTIPGATIVANGEQAVSNSVHIKVLPADEQGNGSSSGYGGNAGRNNSNQAFVSNNELFITATVNKTSVYEQEAIVLTYKIYKLVDLRGFENVKLPDFKGFHSQEVELPNDRKWGLEHYKGRNYQTTIYRQFVLFPQQAGQMTIDAARFDASIVKAVAVADPMEAFFNGGSNYIEVKKTLVTPQLNIQVKALPAGKPSTFSGGVGEFNISSSINSTEVKTNDAVTVKLVISGTGNLKLISAPEISFPEDFEVYDPKIENNSRLTTSGLSGNMVIEYLAIPRMAGSYKIPAVNFSYFDTKSSSYKTLTTEGYELQVAKGEGNASQVIANFTNKEDLKVLNEDIRYIKLGHKVVLAPKGRFFYSSWGYWLCYLIPSLLFLLFVGIYRKRIAANSNMAKVRTKKANKVAVRRMKQAGKLLSENRKDDFYDEVTKALWGYVSDKLNIPGSRLSKDNVEEELQKYGVDAALIKEFIDSLNHCEYARFAPGDAGQAMDDVYKTSLEVISKMESSIKHEGGHQ